MAQGPRRWWNRVAFAGLGVVFSTGLVGCMNGDKDKIPPKIGANAMSKAPGAGLPNTVTLPGQPGSGGIAANKSGSPYTPYGNNGIQQTGGFNPGPTGKNYGGQPGFNTGTGPAYNTGNSGSFGSGGGGGGIVPSAGPNTFQGGGANYGSMPGPNMSPNTQGLASPGAGPGAGFAASPPVPPLNELGPIPPSPPPGVGGVAGGEIVYPPTNPTARGSGY